MIGIIGAGRLGSALIGYYSHFNSKILISTKNINNQLILNRQVYPTINNIENIQKSHLINLCVKPSDFDNLSKEIRPYIQPDQLFVSWMANIDISTISTKLNIDQRQVCRAMGNIFIQHKNGTVCLYTTSTKYNWNSYFPVINKIWLSKEKIIDTCTVAVGCGPAYISEFINMINNHNINNGLKCEQSMLILKENLRGLTYWLDNGLNINNLKEQVSSPGGLTEQGLNKIKNSSIDTIIKELYN